MDLQSGQNLVDGYMNLILHIPLFPSLACLCAFVVSCDRSPNISRKETPTLKVSETPKTRKYYTITSDANGKKYSTWEYEILSSGAVKFVHFDSKQTVIVSQPFTIIEKTAGVGW